MRWSLVVAALTLAVPTAEPPPGAPPHDARKQRGVALGLFAEDVSFSYTPLLQEIAALGATHVALVVPLYQTDGAAVKLRLHTRLSPTLGATAEAVRAAHRLGLEVTLFPIVRLESPRPGEWRGTLAPSDPDAWFASYESLLGDLAAVATLTGVTRLVVGSELSSLDADLARWRPLVQKVRAVFPGTLVYSANWDHYRAARLFELVDEIGVTAYFNLREKGGPADVPALVNRWRWERGLLDEWRAGQDKPFVFTEVGYRSRAGSSAEPWNEGAGGEVDVEEQRRAYAAFRQTWTAAAPPPADPKAPRLPLEGLYIWNWYGHGGAASAGYTPRGKPAITEVKGILEEL
jgi:hypothetical protein